MTFIGFVAFLDSPKKDVKNVIEKINKYDVKVKILTGDNTNIVLYLGICVLAIIGLYLLKKQKA